MHAGCQVPESGTDEVDMDERMSVLENDIAHIKVDITEIKVDLRDLRGKLDAANDAIFRSREDLLTRIGALREDLLAFREDSAARFGAHTAALEKAVGDLRALIKEESGKSRFWNAMTQVWVLLAFATAFGFLGRALSWW
jgi:hypothetical protein